MPINIHIDDVENTTVAVLKQTGAYLLALAGEPVPVSNDDIARFLQQFGNQGLGQPTTPAANDASQVTLSGDVQMSGNFEQDPVREQAEKNSDAAPPPPPPPAREQVADPLAPAPGATTSTTGHVPAIQTAATQGNHEFGNSPMPAGATPLNGNAPPPPPAPAGSAAAQDGSAPPPPPPGAPRVGTLDNNGLPWDERIHASTKTTNKDGTWKAKRGVDPAVVHTVEAELRQVMHGAPTPPPPPGTPPMSPIPVAGANWSAFLMRVSKARAEGKHTMAQLDEVCASHNIPKFALLSNRLDLLPVVETDLEMRGLL